MAPVPVISLLSKIISELLNTKISFVDIQDQLFLMENKMIPTNPVLAEYIKITLKKADEYGKIYLFPKDIFSNLKHE